MGPDLSTSHAEDLDAASQFVDGGRGILHREGCEPCEPIGFLRRHRGYGVIDRHRGRAGILLVDPVEE